LVDRRVETPAATLVTDAGETYWKGLEKTPLLLSLFIFCPFPSKLCFDHYKSFRLFFCCQVVVIDAYNRILHFFLCFGNAPAFFLSTVFALLTTPSFRSIHALHMIPVRLTFPVCKSTNSMISPSNRFVLFPQVMQFGLCGNIFLPPDYYVPTTPRYSCKSNVFVFVKPFTKKFFSFFYMFF